MLSEKTSQAIGITGALLEQAAPPPPKVLQHTQVKWPLLRFLFDIKAPFIRVRQRSGKGVVRRNGCPQGCFRDSYYCALWGFWCLNMANSVQYPLPLFWAFPLWRGGGAIAPPPHKKRGISESAMPARYPITRQNACDTPLCDTISKGIAR